MKAGRELDALIAEKVMGWIPWLEKRGDYYHVVWQKDEREPYRVHRNWEVNAERYKRITVNEIIYGKHIEHLVFKPSTQIADAWLVVEKIIPDGDGEIELEWDQFKWTCEFGYHGIEGVCRSGYAEASTAPLAICLAALKAVE